MGKCTSKQNTRRKSQEISRHDTIKIDSLEEYKELKLIPNFEINAQAKLIISRALSVNPLFRGLTPTDYELIYKCTRLYAAEGNKFIFEQGSIGASFFIINSGRVELYEDNSSKGILSKENSFGHISLFSDFKHPATIKTLSHCSFFTLKIDQLLSILRSVSLREYDNIKDCVSNAKIFSNLSGKQKGEVSKKAMLARFSNKDAIFLEGEKGDILYILKSGIVAFKKNNNLLNQLSTLGEIFGEGSLLTGNPRRASAVAYGEVELVIIDKKSLSDILGVKFKESLLKNIALYSLRSDSCFDFFNKIELQKILEKCKWKEYEKNTIVFPQPRTKDIKIICTGYLKCENNHRFYSYQVIGMNNANEKALCSSSYIADDKSIIGEVELTDIQTLMGVTIEALFEQISTGNFLRCTRLFRDSNLVSIKTISGQMTLKKYQQGETIFNANDRLENLFVVYSGNIEIRNKKQKIVKVLQQHEILGEFCLILPLADVTATATVYSELYEIHKSALETLPEIEIFTRKALRRTLKEIDLKNLFFVSAIPSSSKRMKYCVMQRGDKSLYDLTVIPFHYLSTTVDCYALVNEKEVYINTDHELIQNLIYYTADEVNAYLLHEHINGCALREVLPVSEDITKIIISFLVLTVHYLHEKNIAHRNISTDNIIVDSHWYPYLTDFKWAHFCADKTYSKVTDPFYRSPEMIEGRGYTKATDYWSIGVVMYELIYKRLPFGINDSDSPIEAYQKILEGKSGLSIGQETNNCNRLIANLLVREDKRYGFEAIRNSPWMSQFNFDGLTITENQIKEITGKNTSVPNYGRKIQDVVRSVILM